MPVIAIKKDCPPYEYDNKKAAVMAIKAAGDDPDNYVFKYLYDEMARRPYSKGYKKRHNEASLRWHHKNKVLKNNGLGRPAKQGVDDDNT